MSIDRNYIFDFLIRGFGLQFVAGFHHSSTAKSPDKLKFVGHFLIRQQYPGRRKLTPHAVSGRAKSLPEARSLFEFIAEGLIEGNDGAVGCANL